MKYLRLLRFPNLLILALAMYMVRLMLVEPLMIISFKAPKVSPLDFLLLVISTLLIAAGGYVINDIEDVETDAINKPQKMVVSKSISIDAAWNIYLALTFIGICIGFYITFFHQVKYAAYVQLVASGLLYFYSTTYKKMLLIGNVLVSFLTSLSLALVYLTEAEASSVKSLKILVTGYIVFAFLISMIRELIKDIQDRKGDEQTGCRTLPVVAGITVSKLVTVSLLAVMLLSLILIQLSSHQWDAIKSFIYVITFIQIPLVLLIVSVVIASTENDYARCSVLAKVIMVTGILSMPVFYYDF